MTARRHDDHEVGRRAIRTLGPVASQFGKYELLTMTGTPVRDTSNEIESSALRTFETFTSGSGFFAT